MMIADSASVAVLILCLGTQSQLSSGLETALSGMAASDYQVRQQGARQLASLIHGDPSLLLLDSVVSQFTSLLEVEVSAFEAGELTTPNSYSGRQREFLAEDLTVLTTAFLNRPTVLPGRFLEAAIRLPHNAGTEFTSRLARHGAATVSAALQLAATSRLTSRTNGYSLIGEIIHANDRQSVLAPVSAAQRLTMLQRLRLGLEDAQPQVRKAAIAAIVAAYDVEAIPMLTSLVNVDPDSGVGRPAAYQSVRAAAAAALVALRR